MEREKRERDHICQKLVMVYSFLSRLHFFNCIMSACIHPPRGPLTLPLNFHSNLSPPTIVELKACRRKKRLRRTQSRLYLQKTSHGVLEVWEELW